MKSSLKVHMFLLSGGGKGGETEITCGTRLLKASISTSLEKMFSVSFLGIQSL